MSGTVAQVANEAAPIIDLEGIGVRYRTARGYLDAVRDVSLSLPEGSTLGIVGESGCGKSSLARAVVQLPRPTSGCVKFRGEDITALSERRLRPFRRAVQMIFQDPISSINPRRRVADVIREPLWGESGGGKDRVDSLLEAVGLGSEFRMRRRHELSGGQAQRVSIARALASDPAVLVCDEAVSALDVSVQAQILNLLTDVRQRFGLSMLFISHDLAVVNNVSDHVAVMYLGTVCEIGSVRRVVRTAAHHYTAALFDSAPERRSRLQPGQHRLRGDVPSPFEVPPGCPFHTRCPAATEICRLERPPLAPLSAEQSVACHHPIVTKPDHRR